MSCAVQASNTGRTFCKALCVHVAYRFFRNILWHSQYNHKHCLEWLWSAKASTSVYFWADMKNTAFKIPSDIPRKRHQQQTFLASHWKTSTACSVTLINISREGSSVLSVDTKKKKNCLTSVHLTINLR